MKSHDWNGIECIAILVVHCDINKTKKVEHLEQNQERYIRKYAKANNIKVVDVIHSKGLGQYEVNRFFNKAVEIIRSGKAQGIIAVNMLSIASNLEDVYLKVGKVRSAGGEMFTVDEGRLKLNIQRRNQHGK